MGDGNANVSQLGIVRGGRVCGSCVNVAALAVVVVVVDAGVDVTLAFRLIGKKDISLGVASFIVCVSPGCALPLPTVRRVAVTKLSTSVFLLLLSSTFTSSQARSASERGSERVSEGASE